VLAGPVPSGYGGPGCLDLPVFLGKKAAAAARKTIQEAWEMARIEWDPTLSVGVDSIDQQHRFLVELINKIAECVRTKRTEKIGQAFHFLREYTVYHFNEEEAYMHKVGYPGLAEQKKAHLELKQRVKEFQDNFYRKADMSEGVVLEFLRHWLIDHVLHMDLGLKRYQQEVKQKQEKRQRELDQALPQTKPEDKPGAKPEAAALPRESDLAPGPAEPAREKK
jgi:hemerythrin-like metal-binding protein